MLYYDQPQRSQIVLEIFPKDGVSVSGEKKNGPKLSKDGELQSASQSTLTPSLNNDAHLFTSDSHVVLPSIAYMFGPPVLTPNANSSVGLLSSPLAALVKTSLWGSLRLLLSSYLLELLLVLSVFTGLSLFHIVFHGYDFRMVNYC